MESSFTSLVSTQEAIKLSDQITVGEVQEAYKIYEHWNNHAFAYSEVASFMWMLGAIYQAGRVQGIREERRGIKRH